jgi:cysteine-rich repeat protein
MGKFYAGTNRQVTIARMCRIWGPIVALVCALGAGMTACVSPDVTHCPTVDCPKDKVCDNHGGCAFPDQLTVCAGQVDGTACSYQGVTNASCAGGLCVPNGCGNNALTADEVCDDGNTVNGDGCSADCQSNETCGNGKIDSAKGEQCDDNNTTDGDGCQHDCQLPRCGDGVKDPSLSEECDAGEANANTPDAACRTNCQLPRCGDGVTDPGIGEVCDDANNQSGDGCSGDCKSNETCGNHVIDTIAGEVCDDGNTTGGDGCSANCKSQEVCGNGVIDASKGEICDDTNTVSGDGCSADCKSLETCGNGILDTITEQCDLGMMNSNAPDAMCRTNCKLPVCGDGIKDVMHGEACDNGMANGNQPNACRTNCQLPRCGDTIKDTGEVCDDGNTAPGDGCSADCKSLETCGNGIVDVAKGEQCDDANTVQTDGCHNNCKIPTCGDGLLDPSFGEACDLGMMNSNAANATCRTNCQPQRCGDGVPDLMKGEVCDDGNTTSGDNCSADCKSNETCGNGITDVAKNEQCDDGNTVQTDSCHNNCKVPSCGDGLLDTAFNEQCDLGALNSNAPNANCRTTCVLPKCGDMIVDNMKGEVCDDGNSILADGCRPDCLSTEVCGNGILDPEMNEQCDDGNTRGRDGCSACLPEAGIVYQPGSAPLARDMNALVYDGARQKVVMFGGWAPAGNLNDTYEWDGTSWVKMHPKHAPKGRLAAAVAYDAKRHRVVLFGGYSANFGVVLADTWEYDGVDWKQLSPTTVPPARAEAAMAYDANRGKVIMYGGYDGTNPRSDMFEWSGTNWAALTPSVKPGNRQGASMAYDAKNNNVVLFGGAGTNKHTWTWSGTAWTDQGATAVITNVDLDQTAMVFDANLQAIVLWDGLSGSTYHWSGTAWTAQAAATPTTPRTRFAMTYDSIRKQVVLFGGCQGASATTGACQQGFGTDFADTWLRTGTTWAAAAAFAQPTARMRSAAAYDPIRRKTVLFGGQTTDRRYNCTTASCMPNDIWEWDGHKWTSTTATGTPAGRAGHLMDYDSAARAIKVYAGDSYDGTNDNFFTQVYSYNGSAWTSLTATGRVVTQTPTMSYDSVANRLISFGGSTNPLTNFLTVSTTYYWDSGGWHQLTPATTPPARRGSQAAYDPIRRRTVMFSGNPGNGTSLADTWEFDGTNWRATNAPSGPTERIGGNLYFNSDLGKVCVFGNAGQIDGEDLWEWNGTAWNERTLIGTIPSKYEAAIAYDAANQELVTFSGRASGSTGGPTQGTFLIQYEPNTAVESCTSAQIDYDNDTKAGCADEDCWGVCTPLCAPGTTCPASAPRCGDLSCSPNENCNICPGDCGVCVGKCGDFHCDSGETPATCPNDC